MIMMRNTRNASTLAAVAMAVGLVASACSGSSDSGTQKTTEAATSATSSSTAAVTTTPSAAATTTSQGTPTAAPGGAGLQSLLPAPPNSAQTKGPDNIADNGIHMYYQVNGSPNDVMNAYKTALEGKGWQVTTVVTSGGGATYTGTNGDAYGVFDGGGYNATTYVDVCTWPTKPANPTCNRGDR
jgi:hypothetical protein